MMTNFRAFGARLWRMPAIRAALLAFLVLRLLTFFVATVGYLSQPTRINLDEQPVYNLYNTVVISPEPIKTLIAPWYRWDTGWYVYIAYQGYQANEVTYAFSPLYPVLIRLVANVVGDYLLAAILISNIACIIFFIFVYRRFERWSGHVHARWVLRTLVFFPTAFYLVAGYADSLGLALALAAWEAMEKQRYARAGLLGLLAGLARPQLWIMALPMLYQMGLQFRAEYPETPPKFAHFMRWSIHHVGALWALMGAGLGTAIYLFLPSLFGIGSTEAAGTAGWSSTFAFPGLGFLYAIGDMLRGQATVLEIINIFSFATLLILIFIGWKKLDRGHWLYMVGSIFVLSLILNQRVHLEGMTRYMLHVYPLFFIIAGWLIRKRRWQTFYFIVSGFMSILAIFLFTNWVWIA